MTLCTKLVRFGLLLALILVSAGPAQAQFCDTPFGPCIFPPGCAYVQDSPGFSYPGGHSLNIRYFEASAECAPIPGDGLSDVQVIHATMVGHWKPNGGPTTVVGGPAILTMRVVGGPPIDPRPFSLELLAMDLTGMPGGVSVRESPTRPSIGQGLAQGGGPYHIDSFFDVFTELSLDDGQTWLPSTDSERVRINQSAPLPARKATWGTLKATYR